MSRLLRLSILASVVLALAVLASPAMAQPPGGAGGGGRFGGGMMGGMMGGGMMGGGLGLLRNEQVQGELKLTEEQKTKLQDLADKLRDQARERMGDMRDLSDEQRRERFQQMMEEGQKRMEEARKSVEEILTADQAKRLKQIEWQQLGPAALLQPEVAEAVGLSGEQKEQLATISRDAQEKRMQLFQGARGGEQGDRRQQGQDMRQRFEEMREKGEQITQEFNKKSMAVLQPEQKGKLKELMGAPFELDRSQMFGGPGRGPGAQGGERGDRGAARGGDRPRRSQQRQE